MQAVLDTAAQRAATRDLHALVSHLLRSSHSDVFREIADLDLSLTQLRALHVLDRADRELSVKELAEWLGVSLPVMSRTVEGLHARGFAQRREDAADRRVKRVRPTDAGREVPRAIQAARLSTVERFVAALDEADVERLAAALAALAARPELRERRPGKDSG